MSDAVGTSGVYTPSASDDVPEGETIDVADIADIAPVAPAEVMEDSVVPSTGSRTARTGEPSVEELTQQIRDLEARLDRMLDERRAAQPGSRPSSTPGAPRVPDLDFSAERAATAAAAAAAGAAADTPVSPADEVLASEFYAKRWGKTGMRERAEEVDELGFDASYEEKRRPFIDFLYRYFFRVQAEGVHNIPSTGRCVIVANHAGGPLPYDGLMLRAAVRREHPQKRDLRWLTEDFVFYLPFVGVSLNRLGAVRACPENAERLLAREAVVAVFPEGAKGIGKPFGERYRLQRFGRGGFVRLCMRTSTPIVPCAIVGAEEANPTVYRLESLAKLAGLPYLPVTPTFPALGPLGLLPAPTKWKIRFGSPIRLDSYGPQSADDDLLVSRLAEGVRGVIQDMLSNMLATRRSVWLG
ncbi:MAG: acyltransferase family protein [Polyangiaceae bacterium]|nr:acyltransferase family protein [Polyangiaceae bacterium]